MKIEAGEAVGEVVLVRKLAEGGMGSIWVGDHRTLKRHVAVKFLAKERLDAPEAGERFSREARIVTRVRHPHVPEVFEYGFTSDGTPFLVMTLLDGVDLTKWIARHGRFTLPELGELIDQVGTALDAVHALGIVHRDVTPANIILTSPSSDSALSEDKLFHAYLIDFGIAKWNEPDKSAMLTHPGTTVGTPSYMSPEQLMGSVELDERADIWSLGIVAYLCLTGRLPFTGKTFREQCLAIYCGKFPPVRELRPELPPALDRWFSDVLCGELDRRFRSVAAMSEAFKVATGQSSFDSVSRGSENAWAQTDVTASALPTHTRTAASPPRFRQTRHATLTCAVGGALLGACAAYFIASPRSARAIRVAEAPETPALGTLGERDRAPDGATARHSLQGGI